MNSVKAELNEFTRRLAQRRRKQHPGDLEEKKNSGKKLARIAVDNQERDSPHAEQQQDNG